MRSPCTSIDRAARHAGLQPVTEVIAQLLADAGGQVADDARDLGVIELCLQVERAASVARIAVVGRDHRGGVRVGHAQFRDGDRKRLVQFARCRRRLDRPVAAALQAVELEARIVEHARQRDRHIVGVDGHRAVGFVGIDAAPQVFDAGQAGPRVAERGESRRRFLGRHADALQVRLETVAHDRFGAVRVMFDGRFAGARRGPFDLDQVVRHQPARIEAHQLVEQAPRIAAARG